MAQHPSATLYVKPAGIVYADPGSRQRRTQFDSAQSSDRPQTLSAGLSAATRNGTWNRAPPLLLSARRLSAHIRFWKKPAALSPPSLSDGLQGKRAVRAYAVVRWRCLPGLFRWL